jgi:hypothetical protein
LKIGPNCNRVGSRGGVSFQRAAQSKHTPIVTAAWHPSMDSPREAPSFSLDLCGLRFVTLE